MTKQKINVSKAKERLGRVPFNVSIDWILHGPTEVKDLLEEDLSCISSDFFKYLSDQVDGVFNYQDEKCLDYGKWNKVYNHDLDQMKRLIKLFTLGTFQYTSLRIGKTYGKIIVPREVFDRVEGAYFPEKITIKFCSRMIKVVGDDSVYTANPQSLPTLIDSPLNKEYRVYVSD